MSLYHGPVAPTSLAFDRWITLKRAARILQVDVVTVRRLIRGGALVARPTGDRTNGPCLEVSYRNLMREEES